MGLIMHASAEKKFGGKIVVSHDSTLNTLLKKRDAEIEVLSGMLKDPEGFLQDYEVFNRTAGELQSTLRVINMVRGQCDLTGNVPSFKQPEQPAAAQVHSGAGRPGAMTGQKPQAFQPKEREPQPVDGKMNVELKQEDLVPDQESQSATKIAEMFAAKRAEEGSPEARRQANEYAKSQGV